MGVSPKNQVVSRDICRSNCRVVEDLRFAAELQPPLPDRLVHRVGRPSAKRVIQRPAGWPDHDERIHKSVIDRSLKAMPFPQLIVWQPAELPARALFLKLRRPGIT